MSQTSLPVDALLRTACDPSWKPDPYPDLRGVKEVAVDFETTGLRWWAGDRPVGAAVAWKDPASGALRSAYLPTNHEGGNNLPPERVQAWLLEELRGKYLYNLNTKFDLHMARAWHADLEGVVSGVGDVAHYAALLDDNRKARLIHGTWQTFSLEAIAQDYVGEGKVQGLDMSRGAGVYPAHMVAPYARQDAALVLKILDKQRPLLAGQELMEVVALEDEVTWAALEMERNASPIDVEKLHRWLAETEQELIRLNTHIGLLAGFDVNPDSSKDLARLFASRGLESDAVTETGRPSFAGGVLERAAKTDQLVAVVLQAARLTDLRSKYLIPYSQTVGADGLLRYALNQLRGERGGTISGRFSSTKITRDEGANIQQVMAVDKQLRLHCAACATSWKSGTDDEKIVRHYASHPDARVIRELFVPAAGKQYVAADADQIEYRIFAHMANSQRLLEVYARDPHADFHETVGEMVHRFRPDFERKRVKNCNFAVLFGAGLGQMADMLGMGEAEARELLDTYDEAFPEARALMRQAMDVARVRGYVKTIAGRRARFPEAKRLHSALNRAVQGSAADVNKKKVVQLYRERKRLGLTMRITNHDEVAGDVHDDEGARLVGEVLNEQSYPLRVPILWSVNVGSNWAECK